MAKLKTVFSEYEIKNSAIKINSDSLGTFSNVGCVGSIEETLDCKTVTKKCEGVVKKTVTKGAGTGEAKISLHINYDLYVSLFGMDQEGLKEGVYAYGTESKHKEFTYVAEVIDEDGNKKYIAYPKCSVKTGPGSKIENGSEEVQEIEMTFSLYSDENDNCKYECPVSELGEDASGLKTKWMTAFTSELVRA